MQPQSFAQSAPFAFNAFPHVQNPPSQQQPQQQPFLLQSQNPFSTLSVQPQQQQQQSLSLDQDQQYLALCVQMHLQQQQQQQQQSQLLSAPPLQNFVHNMPFNNNVCLPSSFSTAHPIFQQIQAHQQTAPSNFMTQLQKNPNSEVSRIYNQCASKVQSSVATAKLLYPQHGQQHQIQQRILPQQQQQQFFQQPTVAAPVQSQIMSHKLSLSSASEVQLPMYDENSLLNQLVEQLTKQQQQQQQNQQQLQQQPLVQVLQQTASIPTASTTVIPQPNRNQKIYEALVIPSKLDPNNEPCISKIANLEQEPAPYKKRQNEKAIVIPKIPASTKKNEIVVAPAAITTVPVVPATSSSDSSTMLDEFTQLINSFLTSTPVQQQPVNKAVSSNDNQQSNTTKPQNARSKNNQKKKRPASHKNSMEHEDYKQHSSSVHEETVSLPMKHSEQPQQQQQQLQKTLASSNNTRLIGTPLQQSTNNNISATSNSSSVGFSKFRSSPVAIVNSAFKLKSSPASVISGSTSAFKLRSDNILISKTPNALQVVKNSPSVNPVVSVSTPTSNVVTENKLTPAPLDAVPVAAAAAPKREIRNIQEANELIVAATSSATSPLRPREIFQVVEEDDDEEEEEEQKLKVHETTTGRSSPSSATSSAVCPVQSNSLESQQTVPQAPTSTKKRRRNELEKLLSQSDQVKENTDYSILNANKKTTRQSLMRPHSSQQPTTMQQSQSQQSNAEEKAESATHNGMSDSVADPSTDELFGNMDGFSEATQAIISAFEKFYLKELVAHGSNHQTQNVMNEFKNFMRSARKNDEHIGLLLNPRVCIYSTKFLEFLRGPVIQWVRKNIEQKKQPTYIQLIQIFKSEDRGISTLRPRKDRSLLSNFALRK